MNQPSYEQLPKETTFGTVLKVKKGSPITQGVLKSLFNLGKVCGLGSWKRQYGQYAFRLKKIKGPDEAVK